MICTEWLTSSWWTSTRTSGARPLPPWRGHPGHTAVSPPDELTASPTGTRDFSLFSKRTEPHWTGPEHSRQETDKEEVTSQCKGNNTAKDRQWHTLTVGEEEEEEGGGNNYCTLTVPLLFSSLIKWWLLTKKDRNIRIGVPFGFSPSHRKPSVLQNKNMVTKFTSKEEGLLLVPIRPSLLAHCQLCREGTLCINRYCMHPSHQARESGGRLVDVRDTAGLWGKMRTAGPRCTSEYDAAASPHVISQVYSFDDGMFTTWGNRPMHQDRSVLYMWRNKWLKERLFSYWQLCMWLSQWGFECSFKRGIQMI